MTRQLIIFACLFALAAARRHLCDDLTLPDCANGDKADYNPTGENRSENCKAAVSYQGNILCSNPSAITKYQILKYFQTPPLRG